MPFNINLKEGDVRFLGEVGYLRYPYLFNGIGNEVSPDVEEQYIARFPRVRFTALRKINSSLFGGVRYWFQDTRVIGSEAGGLLETGNIPGANHSRVSGLGPVLLYDKRENLYAARSRDPSFPRAKYFLR